MSCASSRRLLAQAQCAIRRAAAQHPARCLRPSSLMRGAGDRRRLRRRVIRCCSPTSWASPGGGPRGARRGEAARPSSCRPSIAPGRTAWAGEDQDHGRRLHGRGRLLAARADHALIAAEMALDMLQFDGARRGLQRGVELEVRIGLVAPAGRWWRASSAPRSSATTCGAIRSSVGQPDGVEQRSGPHPDLRRPRALARRTGYVVEALRPHRGEGQGAGAYLVLAGASATGQTASVRPACPARSTHFGGGLGAVPRAVPGLWPAGGRGPHRAERRRLDAHGTPMLASTRPRQESRESIVIGCTSLAACLASCPCIRSTRSRASCFAVTRQPCTRWTVAAGRSDAEDRGREQPVGDRVLRATRPGLGAQVVHADRRDSAVRSRYRSHGMNGLLRARTRGRRCRDLPLAA